jgi:Flp pilus assembly pilin Flp
MSSRYSSTFANFLNREDGPTAVEYAAMLGLLVVGCIAAVLLPGTGTDSSGKGRTFTINLGGRTYGTRVAHVVESWDTGDGAAYGAEQGDESTVVVGRDARSTNDTYPARSEIRYNADAEASSQVGAAPTRDQGDASDSSENAENMSDDDARQAIIGLLEAYPKFFPVAKETIQKASIVRHEDHIRIDRFTCNLETRNFVYGPVPTGRGQGRDPKDGIFYSGVFYQDDNGAWTGKITN